MAKTISLREVKDTPTVCRLRRDNYSQGDWTIHTDGHTVWISKQKVGAMPTAEISIPKGVFNKLLAGYERRQHVDQ